MAFATDNRGGGQALPPYLQGRTMADQSSPFQTKPMITPASSIVPGEVNPKAPAGGSGVAGTLGGLAGANGQAGGAGAPQPTNPGNAHPGPQTLYDFLKHDLEDQRKSAMANAETDASARGVYYGSPLTTSKGDIQTEFLKGMGTLDANMLQNEQSNERARTGQAISLLNGMPLSGAGGPDKDVLSQLGMLFGSSGNAGVAGERTGPVITPKNGNKTQSMGK